MKALLGLACFFVLIPVVGWVWPHLCDAAFLTVALGGLLFSCPWVILGGFVIYCLWSNHKEEEAKKAKKAEQERRLERMQESLERLEAAKAKPKARKHVEHSGVAGSDWRWN